MCGPSLSLNFLCYQMIPFFVMGVSAELLFYSLCSSFRLHCNIAHMSSVVVAGVSLDLPVFDTVL